MSALGNCGNAVEKMKVKVRKKSIQRAISDRETEEAMPRRILGRVEALCKGKNVPEGTESR